jgi:hypothetical protein
MQLLEEIIQMPDNSDVPHYSKAPITEAIIDIHVKNAPSLSLEDLEAIHPQVERE